jgi:hypothetical protein
MLSNVMSIASARKLRLFVVGCNGLASRFGGYEHDSEAIGVAERYADGLATDSELEALWAKLNNSRDTEYTTACFAVAPTISGVVDNAIKVTIWTAKNSVDAGDAGGEQKPGFQAMEDEERKTIVSLFRDIFGNPFRSITFSLEWRADTAVTLARQMYDARDFSAMPIRPSRCRMPGVIAKTSSRTAGAKGRTSAAAG